MDLTYLAGALPASKQETIWWLCFSLLTLVVFKILLRSEAEDAIEFSVPVPEACRSGWEGKQLDEPSIKVGHAREDYDYLADFDYFQTSGSTAVQCYSPATGRLLGLVNPVTADEIDRIVAKATKAQQAWAKSSFAERRQVLKSLLKYVCPRYGWCKAYTDLIDFC